MKKKILIITLLFSVLNDYAQTDPNFFNINTINPAYVGIKDNWSLGLSYRTIYSGVTESPKTFIANTYAPINKKIGIGISILNNSIGPLNTNVINADVSYKMSVNKKTDLSIGIKSGITTKKIDLIEFLLPDGTIGNRTLNQSKTSKEFNLGIGAYIASGKLLAGISVPNLLKKETKTNKKIFDIAILSSYEVAITEKMNIEPAVMLTIPKEGNVNYYISANIAIKKIIGIGVNYRKDILGVQISSPKIANLFKVGLIVEFGNSPWGDYINPFTNFDFKTIAK